MPLVARDGDGHRARGAIVLMTVPEPGYGGDGDGAPAS